MASVQVMDYNELLQYWQTLNGQVSQSQINEWITTANQYNVSDMQAIEDLVSSSSGSIPIEFTKTADGLYNVSGIRVTAQQTTGAGLPNSNVATTSRSTVTTMVNRGSDNGKIKMSTTPASGGISQNAAYYLASVGQAVTAASVGISLGKAIDSALYNANPAYWDSIGMSSLNPETWNSITNGDDSFAAGLFNFVFGLDPNTGNSQAYMDATALAYMAMVLNQNGWFNSGQETITDVTPIDSSWARPHDTVQTPVYVGGDTCTVIRDGTKQYVHNAYGNGTIRSILPKWNNDTRTSIAPLFISDQPFTYDYIYTYLPNGSTSTYTYNSSSVNTTNGTYYGNNLNITSNPDFSTFTTSIPFTDILGSNVYSDEVAWLLFNTVINSSQSVDGVTNQQGATLPDTSSWIDIPSTLASLQSQYPDMFTNAIVWDNVQPDGSNPQLTYVPVPWPDITNYNDSQPTGTTATQTQPQINQNTQTLIDTLMKTIQQTQTQTDTGTSIPPANPVDTGTGDSPSAALPSGSASALWSVYHPTQAQVDSFGAWLWGSPFLTNIGKLFQNPIEGVISLHKIFATPVDAGTGNIVVGTLDSGVSSATVTQQYVYIDCGNINLNEDFSNVFDYPPYTQVSLYLPFIGIVPLDTNDVMRSSINITYGVDVFTGACLAIVNITRDGHTAALYQYSGMCSVEYPLSNVQNSNLVGGLLAIAGGVASMVSSGGVSAPAVLTAAAGAASASKSTVSRSGGFSGNSGAMGCKVPYLIIQRPQTRVAETFPQLAGYPTNRSGKLSAFSGQVNVTYVHVENVPATDKELLEIERLLKSGVLI